MKNNKSLKILIFSWRGPKHPHQGGAEIVTHEHAKAWVRAGHDVTLFTSHFDDAEFEETIDGVKIIRAGSQILTVQLKAFLWYFFRNKNSFDLVIDQFHGLPFFTPLYVRSQKLAFIHEVTKDVWKYNPLSEPFHSFVSLFGQISEPIIFKIYRNIPFLTVSKSTKNELKEYGIRSKFIKVIYNGVHVVQTKIGNKKKVITFIGAIAKDKGIEDALIVFQSLLNTDYKFWVIGKHDDGYFQIIQNLVKKYNLEDRITFWGYVSEKKKFQLLSQSFLVVNPSIREGWGLTVIEAAFTKTPTVSYKVSGLQDAIINRQTGILVKEKKPEILANEIRILMKNPVFYKQLQKNAKKWADYFSWKKATDQSLRLIEKVSI
jgi:glycosyltransferase involved in cell wall biosynthesis